MNAKFGESPSFTTPTSHPSFTEWEQSSLICLASTVSGGGGPHLLEQLPYTNAWKETFWREALSLAITKSLTATF